MLSLKFSQKGNDLTIIILVRFYEYISKFSIKIITFKKKKKLFFLNCIFII